MTPLAQRVLALSALATLFLYFSIAFIRGDSNTSGFGNYFAGFRSLPDLHDVKPLTGNNSEGLAYITFFSGTVANTSDPNINNDPYFVATRLLGYQLMHQKETRTQRNIPFIVLVTSDVPESKRSRLAQDGALVIEVKYVDTPAWVTGEMPQWKDLMTKLRAWQLTAFSRALFLDGDMILNAPLDSIFDDPAAQPISSLPSAPTTEFSASAPEEQHVPSKYLLATMAEANPIHSYPPHASHGDYKDPDYFNAGFFLFAPSEEAFTYYYHLLHSENSFDPKYVEQNLLNHAHAQEGRLPWQRVDTKWNVRFPATADKEGGVKSMHDKWWNAQMDKNLQPYYNGLRWRMEGFYEAVDEMSR